MAPPKRPSLTHLAVPKAAAVASAPEMVEAPTEAPSSPTARTPVPRRAQPDLKTVQVRINKRGWMALRNLASDRDLSLEALMVEALNGILLKHNEPPIVERRTDAKGDYASAAESGEG